VSRDIEVESGKINQNDFALSLAPWPETSVKFLDFGTESTSGSFTIKNVGNGKLDYFCQSALDWIEIAEPQGFVTTETDTIHVSIDRSAITEEIQKEFIKIISFSNETEIRDTVHIYANGLADEDGHYYKIVTIGTQTWMAENLNTGKMKRLNGGELVLSDNGEIEKYCYDNYEASCDVFGGLYSWDEMMDYISMEEGIEYSDQDNDYHGYEFHSQGICPDGWHIPTYDEWMTLEAFVGLPGQRLKADSPLWEGDTINITDDFNFGALPGGDIVDYGLDLLPRDIGFHERGSHGLFWSASTNKAFQGSSYILTRNFVIAVWRDIKRNNAVSVRCIKDE